MSILKNAKNGEIGLFIEIKFWNQRCFYYKLLFIELGNKWNIQARNSSLDDELKDDSSFPSVEFESWNDSSWNSKSSVELNSSPSLLQSKNSLNQCWWRIMETDSVGDKFETVMPIFCIEKVTNITLSPTSLWAKNEIGSLD